MQLDARHSVLSVLVAGYLSSKSDQSFAAEFTSGFVKQMILVVVIYIHI